MTDDELKDALDGLYAWDQGSHSSGIYDNQLRGCCIRELASRSTDSELYPRLFIGRMVRDLFLSEEAMDKGYGPEDAASFLNWLDRVLIGAG